MPEFVFFSQRIIKLKLQVYSEINKISRPRGLQALS